MQPTSKFFLKSLTVWGVIVTALCSYIQQYTGVNVADQVHPAQLSLCQIIVGVVHLCGVVTVILGRFRAVQPLHVIAPADKAAVVTATKLLAFLCIGVAALSMIGCAGQAPIPAQFSSPPAAAPLSASDTKIVQTFANLDTPASLATVETSAATATSLGMYIGIKQASTMQSDGMLLYGAGLALQDFTGGSGTIPLASPVDDIMSGLKLSAADQQSADNIANLAQSFSGLLSIPYNWISSSASNASAPSVKAYGAKVLADNVHALGKGVCDVTSQYAALPKVSLRFELSEREGLVVYSF